MENKDMDIGEEMEEKIKKTIIRLLEDQEQVKITEITQKDKTA